jgi:type II secretory pathway component GspD/PulD (secretin)
MINRIRRDLETLDKPRQQVRVEAQVFEISNTNDFNFALNASYAGRNSGYGFDARTAQLTFNVQENEQATFRATLEALVVRGRARLSARPFSVVLSGEQSTLFLGQTRYVTVLRSRGGQQEAQALQLQIGYALNVTPIVGASGEVLLTVAPRVSTVDALENGTGLPTLGIREINATLRVRDGDTIVLAGLDAQIEEGARRQIAPAQRRNRSHTHLLVLVTARRVGVSAENKEQTGTPTPAG